MTGMVLWMQQLSAQVKASVARIELILGKGWRTMPEANELKVSPLACCVPALG